MIGGETAEHPGLMPEEEYDVAGFAVGIAEKEEIIDGHEIGEKDVLIGVFSSGLHSNGFSLVRNVFDMTEESLSHYYEELSAPLGEVLLTPTKIYVKMMKQLKENGIRVKGCSHITGGGFYENVPRMLRDGVRAVIHKNSYPVPPIFSLLQKKGGIDERMMYQTFNMGLGMVLAVDPKEAERALQVIRESGEQGALVGEIIKGEKGIDLC